MQGIDHIGIAVFSIEDTLPFYTKILQLNHLKTEIVESEKVKVAFIDAINCKIELLEPLNEDSPIYKYLQKHGQGIHHIALKTDNITGEIRRLTDENIQMINTKPKLGAGGAHVAFLHPKAASGVLFELCEKQYR